MPPVPGPQACTRSLPLRPLPQLLLFSAFSPKHLIHTHTSLPLRRVPQRVARPRGRPAGCVPATAAGRGRYAAELWDLELLPFGRLHVAEELLDVLLTDDPSFVGELLEERLEGLLHVVVALDRFDLLDPVKSELRKTLINGLF